MIYDVIQADNFSDFQAAINDALADDKTLVGGVSVVSNRIRGAGDVYEDVVTYFQAVTEDLTMIKKYIGVLNQTGVLAPVATVQLNTLGAAIVWTRDDVGVYLGTLSGAFIADKTNLLASFGRGGEVFKICSLERTDANVILLEVSDLAGDPVDLEGSINIEVKVYQT